MGTKRSDLSDADAVDCDDVAPVGLGLVHLVVDTHLIGLIVHLLAGYLVVDVLRPQAVVGTHIAVVVVSGGRLESVERRHARPIVQVEVRPLVLQTRVRHDRRVLIFLPLRRLDVLRVLHRA